MFKILTQLYYALLTILTAILLIPALPFIIAMSALLELKEDIGDRWAYVIIARTNARPS